MRRVVEGGSLNCLGRPRARIVGTKEKRKDSSKREGRVSEGEEVLKNFSG